MEGAAQSVTRGEMVERFLRPASVVKRLAQRELQMEAVVALQPVAIERSQHGVRCRPRSKRTVLRFAKLHQASPSDGLSAIALR